MTAAMTQAAKDKAPSRFGRIPLDLFSDVATIGSRIKQSYFTVQNRAVFSFTAIRVH